MRTFANTFLLLFLVQGGMSFLDALASLISPVPPLTAANEVMTALVLVMADLIYLCLSMDRRLPKRVFIPLVGYSFAVPVIKWLVPSLAAMSGFALAAAAGQILLLLLVTKPYWRREGGSPTLPESLFQGPAFSLKNMLVFTAVNIVVLPVALALAVMTTADAFVDKYTSGFMHLRPDGLHMSEKIYRRNDQTIRLTAMIHVGERDFYQKIGGNLGRGRTIVLAEGVTDDAKLLRNHPDYGRLAGYLGLASQQEKMRFSGRQIEPDDVVGARRAGNDEVDILRADVDISSFRPETISFLNSLGKQMQESRSLSQQLLGSVAWSEKNVTPEMQKIIVEDVLHHRNEVLIGHLKQALPHYDNIVVPWGALHMAEIEREVLEQGFQLQQVQDRVSIRFGKHAKLADVTVEKNTARQ